MISDATGPPSSTAITAVGVDHVRLSYAYLDADDLDAYASLLHDDIRVDHPGAPPTRGRAHTVACLSATVARGGRHHLDHVVADGNRVAAIGRFTAADTAGALEFADVFTLSAEGLLVDCRRYYHLAPR